VTFGRPRDLTGVRFAVNVFIAATIVWYVLERIADTNAIWAIASMVAASDPRADEAARMLLARMINVLVGCAVGFVVLAVGHPNQWKIPLALSLAVLTSPDKVATGLHHRRCRSVAVDAFIAAPGVP
jgi:uncharacterized membrane protein YccC